MLTIDDILVQERESACNRVQLPRYTDLAWGQITKTEPLSPNRVQLPEKVAAGCHLDQFLWSQ